MATKALHLMFPFRQNLPKGPNRPFNMRTADPTSTASGGEAFEANITPMGGSLWPSKLPSTPVQNTKRQY
jgi:hypothetical protein